MVSGVNRSWRSYGELFDGFVKCEDSKSACSHSGSGKISWVTQSIAAHSDRLRGFFDAREDLRSDCTARTIFNHGIDDENALEESDDVRDRSASPCIFERKEAQPNLDCAALPSKCDMDFQYKSAPCQTSCTLPDQSETPFMERQGDGIDFIFEMVESALCGDQRYAKKSGGAHGRNITFEDLPVYNMPQLQKDSLVGSESVIKFGHSSRSHRTSRTRSRSRSTTSSRRSSRSRCHQKVEEHSSSTASEANRASISGFDSKTKAKAADRIAKKATAYIRNNALEQARNDADREMEEYRRRKSHGMKSSLKKKSNALKGDEYSAFDDLSANHVFTESTNKSTAVSSAATPTITSNSHAPGMMEPCDLNIGSGSSVSSFGGGHSWSQHSNRSLIDALSNSTKKILTPPTVPEIDESTEQFYSTMRTLINFIHSFSTSVYGEGAAAPVNKAVCLLSLAMLVFFWPEDREKDRIKIPRKEVPKKDVTKKASLLTLVTQG